jgi:peptidoglycan/xylan/chitin deacetylase (PgdA/CDA1 family)
MKFHFRRIPSGLLRRIAGTITDVTTSDPVIALTFDDGPNPTTTPAVLRILNTHGAKATFFMTGENAVAHPEVVAAVRAAGHAIGNHSWDHPSFPLISGLKRFRQIRKCAKVIREPGKRLFRPPYGNQTAVSQLLAWLTGHEVIAWSVVLPDWLDHDGAWLAGESLKQVRAGSIILMHDNLMDFIEDRYQDRRPTLDALERILSALENRYEFVTVPELLLRGRPSRVNWFMKPDIDF